MGEQKLFHKRWTHFNGTLHLVIPVLCDLNNFASIFFFCKIFREGSLLIVFDNFFFFLATPRHADVPCPGIEGTPEQ